MSNKVNEINEKAINDINNEIQQKLKEVEDKYGVKIEFGKTRYSKDNYRTKLKVATVSDNGQVNSKETIDFKRNKENGNINEEFEVGGRIETPDGTNLIIDGYNRNAHKYPIKLHNRDGKYKMSVRQLNQCFSVNY